MYLVLTLLLFLSLASNSLGQDQCRSESALRINPTSTFSSISQSESGRLEICYCVDTGNCTWNTILTNVSTGWSWKNVQVACRQLGRDNGVPFSGLGNPIFQSSVPDDNILHSSLFECDGTESHLNNCTTNPIPSLTTGEHTDVHITCSMIVTTGNIKVTGSLSPHQGVVEVYVRSTGQWETVCIDNFHDVEADVACRTLGYASGVLQVLPISSFRGNEINTSPGISGIVCTGSERDIDSCFTIRGTTCSSTSTLAGVTCTPSTSSPGSTRLFTLSRFNSYQRVETLFGGRWGTICDSSWDLTDARVTCRSLNLGEDEAEVPNNFDSIIASQRPLWVSGFVCSGSEANLTLCNLTYPVGYAPGCNHSLDTGLICGDAIGSGGLSAGAIAGIVIGVLVFSCCLCVACLCLICFCWKLCNDDNDDWELPRCCLRKSRRGSVNITSDPIPLRNVETSPVHHETTIDHEASNDEEEEEEKELTKPPPPSYNDAITLEGVKTLSPPEYSPQDNEEVQETDDLPYPNIDSDPAYPPIIPPSSISTEI